MWAHALDHPHIGKPQQSCMCIDCREFRQRTFHDSSPITDTGYWNAMLGQRLRGEGYIVINPRAFNTEEFISIDDARSEAQSLVWDNGGVALIYMPVEVVRQDLPTSRRVSPLVAAIQRQQGLPPVAPTPGASPADTVVDAVTEPIITPPPAPQAPVSTDPNDK